MIHATRLAHLLGGLASPQKPGSFLCWRRPLLPRRLSLVQLNAQLQMSHTEILTGTHDRYDGIQIDPDGLPTDPSEFTTRLTESLQVGQGLINTET